MNAQADLFDLGTQLPRAARRVRRQTTARLLGEVGALRAALKATEADPNFSWRAREFVVSYLRQHGDSPGEDITDAAKDAGIRPTDDRAFGSVYAGLARLGVIEVAGHCERRKGHGTAGGRIWRLGVQRA